MVESFNILKKGWDIQSLPYLNLYSISVFQGKKTYLKIFFDEVCVCAEDLKVNLSLSFISEVTGFVGL